LDHDSNSFAGTGQCADAGQVQVWRPLRGSPRPLSPALLRLAVGAELLEVGPEAGRLAFVAQARESHAGAGDLLHRSLDVVLELRLAPGDAGAFHRVGIIEALGAAGFAAVDPVEQGAKLDARAFAGVVTRQ